MYIMNSHPSPIKGWVGCRTSTKITVLVIADVQKKISNASISLRYKRLSLPLQALVIRLKIREGLNLARQIVLIFNWLSSTLDQKNGFG